MVDRGNEVEDRRRRRMRRRLVLFPVSYHGHLPPMLYLAYMLHRRGFLITIVRTATGAVHFRQADHPDFTVIPIPDGIPPEEASQSHTFVRALKLINNCIQPFTDCLKRILAEAPEDEIVTCLITDALFGFAQAVANSFGLPRIALRTSSAASFIPLTLMYGDGDGTDIRSSSGKLFLFFQSGRVIDLRSHFAPTASRPEEEIPDLAPLKFRDIPTFEHPDQEEVRQFVKGLAKQTISSSGVILNTFEELEEKPLARMREFGTPCFPIGPLHKHSPTARASMGEDDASIIAWLDSQAPNSVVYVSFGSLAAIDEREFAEVAWGLVGSGRPFLLVHRWDLIRPSGLPERLPEEFESGIGKVVKWAPQREVLAHPAVGAFCTHAGWNSTMESISEGVPMICLPNFADQMITARYVAEVWRIGVYVEKNLERGEIASVIRRVLMEGGEGGEIRSRAAHWKDKARAAVEPGGSSSRNEDDVVLFILSLL